MQVLIDTNVFIERESHWAVPEELQELENRLRTLGHDILVHRVVDAIEAVLNPDEAWETW